MKKRTKFALGGAAAIGAAALLRRGGIREDLEWNEIVKPGHVMDIDAYGVHYLDNGEGPGLLLVHGSGGYNRHKPWSIPKGLPDEGESLEQAARRETLEEAGIASGELVPLGSIEYRKSRKRVHAFAGEWHEGYGQPCCASWEVDRAEFMLLAEARERIHPDQRPFLDRLEELLDKVT